MRCFATMLIVFTLPALAQDPQSAAKAWRENPAFQPFNATVKVVISADEALESEITSYVSRELRSLQGILVADTNHDYEINIVAFRVPRDQPTLLVLSYLFTHVMLADKQRGLQLALRADMLPVFNQLYREVHQINDFGVMTFAAKGHLKQQCQGIVAKFDAKVLEPQRKIHEGIREQIKKTVEQLESMKP